MARQILVGEFISYLRRYAHVLDFNGSPERATAYTRAANSLMRRAAQPLDTIMSHGEDRPAHIPNVGEKILALAGEFARRGVCAEIEKSFRTREYRAYETLGKIAGVGPETARKWFALGVTTLPKLRAAIQRGEISLNRVQKYGLEHYSDLNSRIPRAEVTEIGLRVNKLISQSTKTLVKATIAGSYRRGHQSSGDVDILVTTPGGFEENLLGDFVVRISRMKNFICVLMRGLERVTFLFRATEKSPVRQVDVLNIRPESYAAALLYFTGSYSFNEAMRGFAKARKYLLNQNGLYSKSGAKLTLISTDSEREIFSALGLRYVSPANREWFDYNL